MTDDRPDTSELREAGADWDPQAPEVLRDQRFAYDAMRERCPVAHSHPRSWTVFRHADVRHVLRDHATFSSIVSAHASVPNGMDPPEHTQWRALIEPYFSRERVEHFEPTCRRIAADLIEVVCSAHDAELMTAMALPFAARVQCMYLGWPVELADTLVGWVGANHAATLSGDRSTTAAVAHEFETLVADLLHTRRVDGDTPAGDLTEALLRERIRGRQISTAEITSILRNWTMGEVGTIAAAVGILAHAIAADTDLQDRLRRQLVSLPAAIDELLRIQGPLVSNRRVTTRRTTLGGRLLDAGAAITVNWIAANRDPGVFPAPDRFRLDRQPDDNLLYGTGIHVCPGAGLARLELRLVIAELLAATEVLELLPDRPPTSAVPPAAGFATVPLRVVRARG